MPLRDHFRPPLDNKRHWESMHSMWPAMIVAGLQRRLPRGFFAELTVHSGRSVEIDVATFEEEEMAVAPAGEGNGGVATAVWAPPRPTLVVACDLPAQDEYEIEIYDGRRRARLVAAVEIVSPANKDRPESRRAFVAKCANLLRERVSVVIVDIVTTRTANLYSEMLQTLGRSDPNQADGSLYSAACRFTKRDEEWQLETWTETLKIERTLPTMPLWLADNLAVPLELEKSYEESCRNLGIA